MIGSRTIRIASIGSDVPTFHRENRLTSGAVHVFPVPWSSSLGSEIISRVTSVRLRQAPHHSIRQKATHPVDLGAVGAGPLGRSIFRDVTEQQGSAL